MKKLNQQGYNLVELSIAVALLAILASSVMIARSYMAKQTVKASDKAYATQKAIQMFEELRALVNGSEKLGVSVLNNYSDGKSYNTVLTTDQLVDTGLPTANPLDPLSGNRLSNGHMRYLRQIAVNNVPNDVWARQVVVKVWLYDSDSDPNNPGDLLATVGGYLRTIASVESSKQVLDVYCLGLSNVLGWFTTIPSMVPTFKRVAQDIQERNPGLELRLHNITQTGYGRDPYYRPSINAAQAAASITGYTIAGGVTTISGYATSDLPFVYLYPGLCGQDYSASPPFSNANFFDNTELQAAGNILLDYNLQDSPYKTAMCDMYNADMRYPDALAQYAAITIAAAAAKVAQGQPVVPSDLPAPTLRMFLEQLNSSTNYKNALILSMHGEVLPLPNMRNYSDPAKDPLDDPLPGGVYDPTSNRYRRVVTHPQLLHSKFGNGVTLRVYNYYDGLIDPSALDTSQATSIGNRASTISLYFPNLQMDYLNMGITAVIGGVDNAGVSTAYSYAAIANTSTTVYGMATSISHPNGTDTLLTLFNTPMRCPEVVTGGVTTGLAKSSRLYGAEYIPCPVDTASSVSFATDLIAPNKTARNTARWIIALKNTSSGFIPQGQFAVETRLGNDLTTGTSAGSVDQKLNLSRTYFWVGTGSGTVGTSTSGIVPWTERFQFNGDPRDCPYLDVKFGTTVVDPTDSAVTIDADGYNWYFRDFDGNNGYSGFTQTAAGYDTTDHDLRDIPRYYYTYRHGLLNNTTIYGNLNGYSFWHASEGGEIGSTYNPWVNSLQFDKKPWDPAFANSGAVSIDEIQNSDNWTSSAGAGVARSIMRYISGGSQDPNTVWFARTWEGELSPDDWFQNSWEPYGNLPTGTSGFWRVPLQQINTGATDFQTGYDYNRDYQWGVGGRAPIAFMNGETAAGSKKGFMHDFNGTANSTTLADNNYYITNFPMESPLVGSRPWAWTDNISGNLPPEWNSSYYSDAANGRRTLLSMPSIGGVNRVFYDNVGGPGAGPSSPDALWHTVGVVQMSVNAPTSQACFFSFSGLAPQGTFDTSALGKITMAMLLRSFLDGGRYAGAAHIAQLPMVKVYVNSPNNQYPYHTSSTYSVGITLTSPVTTSGGVSFSQAITNIWYRYPGISSNTANFYTDEYPGYAAGAPLSLSTYTESAATSLWVNFKWSTDEKNWYFAGDNAGATIGVYSNSAAHGMTFASNAPMVYNWDISDPVMFKQGNYWIRGEAYRPNYPLHYSYHDLNISVNR